MSLVFASVSVSSGIAAVALSYGVAEQYTKAGPYKLSDRFGDLFASPYGRDSITVDTDVAEHLENNYSEVNEDGWCLKTAGDKIDDFDKPTFMRRSKFKVSFFCRSEDSIRTHSHHVAAVASSADRDNFGRDSTSCIYSGGEISGDQPVNLNCYTENDAGQTRRVLVKVGS